MVFDEWQSFEESKVVKVKRRTHTDKAREYQPKVRSRRKLRSKAIQQHNATSKRRAKNRVARASRRKNRGK